MSPSTVIPRCAAASARPSMSARPSARFLTVPEDGSRRIFEQRGARGLAKWMQDEKRVLVTDTTMRDAHQSLLATRFRTHDIAAIGEAYAQGLPNLFSLECWGGAYLSMSRCGS